MKRFAVLVLPLCCALVLFAGLGEKGDPPDGPYLGQKPPGETPEVFAPGIVSTPCRVYANVTFDATLGQACWTINSDDPECYRGGLIYSERVKGAWTAPKEIFFLDDQYAHRSPFFGYSGRRLYFQAYLKNDQGWDQKERFYYVDRTAEGWSKPVLLDPIFDKYMVHWQFSLDSKNNLYFGGELRGGEKSGGIYLARFQNGKYQEPELIFSNDSFKDAVFGPAISPQGDYLLFARIHSRESENPRVMSIYASFLENDGRWSEPGELGELLNMEGNQVRISPDGQYIFFVRNDGQAYWVSAKVIDRLRPKSRPPAAVEKIAFYSTRSGAAQIYLMNTDGSGLERLTYNASKDRSPAISPDGTQIAFASDRDGESRIYLMNSDGSDQHRLMNSGQEEILPAWSPDGGRVYFQIETKSGNSVLCSARVDGSDPRKLTNDPGFDGAPSWGVVPQSK